MRRLIFCLCLFLPVAAMANPSWNKEYLAFYGGYFDITQDDNAAAQFGAEYRSASMYRGLRAGIGGNVSTDDALYGYGGFFWDIYFTDNIVFTPNIVAGAFHQGNGKDLGHWIEFRSGLELSYQFEDQSRLGLNFNHISNASLGDRNPGAETLFLVYQHPLNMFSKNKGRAPQPEYHAPSGEKRWWQ